MTIDDQDERQSRDDAFAYFTQFMRGVVPIEQAMRDAGTAIVRFTAVLDARPTRGTRRARRSRRRTLRAFRRAQFGVCQRGTSWP